MLEILEDGLSGRGFKTFLLGNPVDVAKSQLPLIFVQGLEERTKQLDNVNDQKDMDFLIGVIIDPAQELGKQSKSKKERVGDRFLMEIISGRNADKTPMEDTVSYQLRYNWTMDGVVFYQESRTAHGVREVPNAYYKEVHYFITAKAAVASR